jgi:hypothetical protein
VPIAQGITAVAGWAIAIQSMAAIVLLALPAAWVLRGSAKQAAQSRRRSRAERRTGARRDDARGDPARDARPELPAARDRLLRLRLPRRLHRHAPAGGRRRLPAAARGRRLGAGDRRPLQHRRQLRDGLGGRPLAHEVAALARLRGAWLAVLVFLFAPKTEAVVLVFAAFIGLTYLSTVPPTAGLVAKFFGTAHMATLFGFVMLSHQIGGFLGAWLGGKSFEWTGSYNWMWYADIVLAAGAALIHLPIREARLAGAARRRCRRDAQGVGGSGGIV